MFAACTVVLVFPRVFCLLSLVYFSCHVRKFTEACTKGDRSNRGVYQRRELLYQSRSVYRPLNFRQQRVYFMYHIVLCVHLK